MPVRNGERKCKAIHAYFWLGAAVLVSQFRLSSQVGLATLALPAFAQAFIHLLLGLILQNPVVSGYGKINLM